MIVVDEDGMYLFFGSFIDRRLEIQEDAIRNSEDELLYVYGLIDVGGRWEVEKSKFGLVASDDEEGISTFDDDRLAFVDFYVVVGIALTLHIFVRKLFVVPLEVLVIIVAILRYFLHDIDISLQGDVDIIFLNPRVLF